MSDFKFSIEKKLMGSAGRAGVIHTLHGTIETPAFTVVGTMATVKGVTPEMLEGAGVEAVLANTYHLYLRPGEDVVAKAGGLGKFMHWEGPTLTDSGGFQVMSLGAAYETGKGKIIKALPQEGDEDLPVLYDEEVATAHGRLAVIDEDGVTFTSHIDGSLHRFTPERSIEIQHKLGADIMFAFDECTLPSETKEYQREAMERTHRWAKRSLATHRLMHGTHASASSPYRSALYGIVQGGRYEDLRKESASVLAGMDFDGYGIGGSFNKAEISEAIQWIGGILPQEKPVHLLGIGEPDDLFFGVEHGMDTFDCVMPTRHGRTGSVYTLDGHIILKNKEYTDDVTPIDSACVCYTCKNFTKAYLSHLLRSGEMLGGVLASVHNIYFIVNLVKKMRLSILDGNFKKLKETFLKRYYQK
jgi:queuine tRNA-ribosyltransferase